MKRKGRVAHPPLLWNIDLFEKSHGTIESSDFPNLLGVFAEF